MNAATGRVSPSRCFAVTRVAQESTQSPKLSITRVAGAGAAAGLLSVPCRPALLGAPALLPPPSSSRGQHVDSSPAISRAVRRPGSFPFDGTSSFTAPVRAAGDRDESGGRKQEPVHARDARPGRRAGGVSARGVARPGPGQTGLVFAACVQYSGLHAGTRLPGMGLSSSPSRDTASCAAPVVAVRRQLAGGGGGALPCGAGRRRSYALDELLASHHPLAGPCPCTIEPSEASIFILFGKPTT